LLRSVNFSVLFLSGDQDQEVLHCGDILEVHHAVIRLAKARTNHGSWLLVLMSLATHYQHHLSVFIASKEIRSKRG